MTLRFKLVLLIALGLSLIACSGIWASTVTKISTGDSHTVALMDDSTVWDWGNNTNNQLGDGTATQRLIPVQVKDLVGVIAISAGGFHTAALKNNGTVWAWGYNGFGQLGDGTKTQRSTPVQVSGLTGVVAIAAGGGHTAVLKNDGTVWTWGNNFSGQLGDGTQLQRLTPVQVSGLTGVVALSAGDYYTAVLKNDGTVWTWGHNNYGQLGDGTTTQRLTPVQVSGLTGVAAISTGYGYIVALKNDGTVWAWGSNGGGQLGDGTTIQRLTPVQVSGLTGVVAISAGWGHTAVLKNDGTVWTWGGNIRGQLGDGTTTGRSTPLQVSGLTGVAAISVGSNYTVALKSDSTMWAWGYNGSGQLGDGTATDKLTPVKVRFDWTPPTGTVVINNNAAYTTSTSVTLAISATNNINTVLMKISNDGIFDTEPWETYSTSKNWTLTSGDGPKTVYIKFKDTANIESDVMTDSIVLDTTPPEVFIPVASPQGWTEGDVTVTFSTTDATSGINHYEVSLDNGTFTAAVSPYVVSAEGNHVVRVMALDNAGNSLTSSQVHTYITRTPPTVYISGPYGNSRQISYIVSYNRAAEITLTDADVTLNKTDTADGTVSISGEGIWMRTVTISDVIGEGTLGISIAAGTASDAFGRTAPAAGPSDTAQISTGIVAVSAGSYHTVAIKNDGTVWSWGLNDHGQLGDGTYAQRLTPVKVSDFTRSIAVDAGSYHTVTLKDDGTVWAWGRNFYGQIGDGTTTDRSTPTQVSGLTGVVAVSVGNSYTVALKNDGTVWAWGDNGGGQLGDGTTIQKSTPVQVSGLTGVVAISAGSAHTVAIKNDGTVWSWGLNDHGQLGDGTTTQRLTPVQVSGLTGVVAISAGSAHTVALKNDGTMWTWGYNYYGQLGDGTKTQRLTPVQVSGLTGVVAISAGSAHTVALKNDGTMWTWGRNDYGQLGDGTQLHRSTPVQVSGLTGVAAISAGLSHTVALKDDGTVWSCGDNYYGMLGDGTKTQRLTPVKAVFDWTLPTGTVSINGDAAYINSTIVTLGISAADNIGTVSKMKISNDGIFDTETWEAYSTTKSWTLPVGDGPKTVYIRFKDATGNESDVTTDTIVLDTVPPEAFTPVATPSGWTEGDVTVTFSTTDALSGINHYEVSLDGGAFVTAASPYVVTTEGNHVVQVKAVDNAGNSRISQVNACISRSAPAVSISSPYRSGRQISYRVSYERAAEINLVATDITLNKTGTASGTISVSGTGTESRIVTISDTSGEGTLGISIAAGTASDAFGHTALSAGPSDTINIGMSIVAVSTGTSHTVALEDDGTVWAWGNNGYGQLGDGTTFQKLTPVKVSDFTGSISVSAGSYHTVALKNDGTVWIWGDNSNGQLGDGTTTKRLTPVQVSGLTGVTAVSAGCYYTAALKSDGTVWAWGDNGSGQLGDGTKTNRLTPVQVYGLTGVAAISAGLGHTIVLKNDGTVWTWGYNNYGQLGDGTTTDRSTPTQVSGLTGVVAVSAGYYYSIALKNDGTVWAWGFGPLGFETTTVRSTPVQVPGLNGLASVSTRFTHTTAVKNDGTVWAWGDNSYGQLGDGTTTQRLTPIQVSGLIGVVAVSAGGTHTTASKDDGTVWTWGHNDYGQLGDGTKTQRLTPVKVVFDWTPPTGTVVINNNDAYTKSTVVTLDISATDNIGTVYQMKISSDGVFDTETWEAYSTTRSWPLTAGNGIKTVYIKFKDAAGNESDVTTDTIVLATGLLRVTIMPVEAVTAGAQWRRVGTELWRNSGNVETGIPEGSCEIEFKSIPGWGRPANVVVSIKGGKTTETSATYAITVSISKSKGSADGTFVYIDRAIVSAAYEGFFYIESDKRESGIRVEMPGHALSSGMRADISGIMGTNSNGERYILANTAMQSFPPNNTGSVIPLGITNKALGGGSFGLQQGVWGWQMIMNTTTGKYERVWGESKGLNNIGMLVRTWGKVNEYEQVQDPAKPAWCVIDDGSGTPVKCIIPRDVFFDRSWSYITVTGISSCEKVGDEMHRVLLIRPGDVIMHN